MDLQIPSESLICLNYPGIVVNCQKALQTLGGLQGLKESIQDKNKRIPLHFRPEDPYCKPVYGDRTPTASLVLRIRRRKKKTPDVSNNKNEQKNLENAILGEILAIVETSITFNSLCDFQYLPMQRINFQPEIPDLSELSSINNLASTQNNAMPHYRSLENELFFYKNMHSKEWLQEESEDPLFLIPSSFTRSDQPLYYCFRDVVSKKYQFPDNLTGMNRMKRSHFTTLVKFNYTKVPTKPMEEVHSRISKARLPQWKIDKVKNAFSNKKVWTTLSLYAEVGPEVTRNDLKLLLPALAYYCLDGPWRSMWVGFGYDCKKNKESKIYQNLDFRLEKGLVALYTDIKTFRRNNNNVKINSKVKPQQKSSFKNEDDDDDDGADDNDGCTETDWSKETCITDEMRKKFKKEMEASYIFKPGITPRLKQTLYQLCHIHEPEVQRLVHLNDGQESFCSEKDGWCLPDTIDKCRAIISSYRKKEISRQIKESDDILTYQEEEEEEEDDGDGNDLDEEASYIAKVSNFQQNNEEEEEEDDDV